MAFRPSRPSTRLAAMRGQLDELAAARDARPDVSGLGALVRKDPWTKTFVGADEDGTVTSALVMRGGTVLRVIGVCLACVTGACDAHQPEQPDAPQPAVATDPGNPWMPDEGDDPPGDAPVPAAPRPTPPPAPTAAERYARTTGDPELAALPESIRNRWR